MMGLIQWGERTIAKGRRNVEEKEEIHFPPSSIGIFNLSS